LIHYVIISLVIIKKKHFLKTHVFFFKIQAEYDPKLEKRLSDEIGKLDRHLETSGGIILLYFYLDNFIFLSTRLSN
jgi:hypothetical protein